MKSIGQREGTWIAVAAIFFVWSLVTVPIPGVNEPHYLTKARQFATPEWCVNDFFLTSSNAHAVFYQCVGPLTTVLPLSMVALLGRLLSYSLIGFGWGRLCQEFGLNSARTITSALLLCVIAAVGNLSGEWIIGGFESKVPAYGFVFLAIAFWLKGQRNDRSATFVFSGTCCGLATALHPIVGGWIGVCLGLSELTLSRSVGWKKFLTRSIAFGIPAIVASLPGVVPAVQLVLMSEVDAGIKSRANLIQVYFRLGHHLDPTRFSWKAWLHTLTSVAICVWSWRRSDSVQKVCDRYSIRLLSFAALICLAGVVIGWHPDSIQDNQQWSWDDKDLAASILRFYPFRSFDGLLPCFTAMLLVRTTSVTKWVAARWPMVAAAVLVLGLFVRPWSPGGYSRQQYSDWQAACGWIEQNTDPKSIVYTPRESFAFKWYADRAEVVSFKDCPQDAVGILEWNRRLNSIWAWSRQAWKDGNYNPQDLRRLRKLTGADYVLTRELAGFVPDPIQTFGDWRLYQTQETTTNGEP